MIRFTAKTQRREGELLCLRKLEAKVACGTAEYLWRINKVLFCFGILAFLLQGCAPKIEKLNYTLPVRVGKPWQPHKQEMGTPDRSGDNFYTYFDKGVLVYVDAKQEIVTALICSWFTGGKHFSGEVYGVRLGDPFPKFVKLWGEPVEKQTRKYDFYQAKWNFKGMFIEVEFWAHSGEDSDLGGKFEQDTAKRIKISL